MPEDKKNVDDMVKLIKKSKEKPVNFAFGQGKDIDACRMAMDKKKPGKSLFQTLKKDNEGISKGAFGSCQLDGKNVILTCEKEFGGLEKLVKEYMKKNQMKFKPLVAKK